MDLERAQGQISGSSQKLAEACADLANTLSANRWHLQRQRRVGIDRFVTEQLGLGLAEDCGPEPIEMMTRAAFSAHKFAEIHEKGFGYDSVRYDVRLTVGQSLTADEIPGTVLDKLFDSEDGKHFVPNDEYEPSIIDQISRSDLDDLLIVREEEIGYRVDESGRILSYDVTHNYLFDDEQVYTMGYASEESRHRSVPIRGDGGEIIDRRPAVVTVLTPEIIERESATISDAFGLFIAEHSLRRSLELQGRSGRAHRRQALGIVSLIGSGMRMIPAR